MRARGGARLRGPVQGKSTPRAFTLTDSRIFERGNVVLTYERTSPSRDARDAD